MRTTYKSWQLGVAEFFSGVSADVRIFCRLFLAWNRKQAALSGATFHTPENRSEVLLRAIHRVEAQVDEKLLIVMLCVLKKMVRSESGLLSRSLAKGAALWVVELFEFGVERDANIFLTYKIRLYLISLWIELFRNGWISQDQDDALYREVVSFRRRISYLDLSRNSATDDVLELNMLDVLSRYEKELSLSHGK